MPTRSIAAVLATAGVLGRRRRRRRGGGARDADRRHAALPPRAGLVRAVARHLLRPALASRRPRRRPPALPARRLARAPERGGRDASRRALAAPRRPAGAPAAAARPAARASSTTISRTRRAPGGPRGPAAGSSSRATRTGTGAASPSSVGDGRRAGRLRCPSARFGVHASLGAFYSLVTKHLGFVPGRDEGKVLGLAASGDAGARPAPVPLPLGRRRRSSTPARGGSPRAPDARGAGRRLPRGRRRVGPAGHRARSSSTGWRAGSPRRARAGVALAGGVFANVRLNGLVARAPRRRGGPRVPAHGRRRARGRGRAPRRRRGALRARAGLPRSRAVRRTRARTRRAARAPRSSARATPTPRWSTGSSAGRPVVRCVGRDGVRPAGPRPPLDPRAPPTDRRRRAS